MIPCIAMKQQVTFNMVWENISQCGLWYAGVVDVCLIPEVKFEVDVLTEYVRQVMKRKGHCVVCIAEGAGQDIVQHGHAGTDKSGNPILRDIGTHLRDVFKESMKVCWSTLLPRPYIHPRKPK